MEQQTQLQWIQDERVERTGRLACQVGLGVFLISALLDLRIDQPILALVEFQLAAACGFALQWRGRKVSPKLRWVPVLLELWIASIAVILGTGGLASPFLGQYLALLAAATVAMQNRFGFATVIGFLGVNLGGWALYSLSGLPVGPVPSGVWVGLKDLMYLVEVIVLVWLSIRNFDQISAENLKTLGRLSEAENRLFHTGKLAEVGDLVASTAHELSQPIQAISVASEAMKRLFQLEPTSDRVLRMNEHISESSSRLNRLVRQLRDFSRRADDYQPQQIDLRSTLESIAALLRAELTQRQIELELDLPARPLVIEADPLQVQQIVLNLANNARDACLESHPPNPKIWLRAHLVGPWIRASVENSGAGIPVEIQGRLFESYFTTKQRGKGTGLGLRICSQLAARNNARILFCSDETHTTFVVDFPRCSAGIGQVPHGLGTQAHSGRASTLRAK